jgi:predicted dienelactone hydrolase
MYIQRRQFSKAAMALSVSQIPLALRAQTQTPFDYFSKPGKHVVLTEFFNWKDTGRDRTIPIKIYRPQAVGSYPLLIFSHGLAGSREGGKAWGEHWATHGFISLHLQHPGSDEELLNGADSDRLSMIRKLRSGASSENLIHRIQDARFAIDEIKRRNTAGDTTWQQVDFLKIGISGHSFGAVTVQTLIGQKWQGSSSTVPLTDERIRAALILSPSARQSEVDTFAEIKIPVMSVTGTRDEMAILSGIDVTAANRLLVFQGMPAGHKYQIVFDGADHMVFNGNFEKIRARPSPELDSLHWMWIKASSTAFWYSHLLGDTTADRWLNPNGIGAALKSLAQFSYK